ncbi:hypothetical protein [Longitalea luteola]|uniref:hypothetical protein n=1 Tax=Longitalea luteola TaxID=2812563 RepID=UPI001A96AEEA|nr:hypothetical protein [Longitalea luteola]
MRKLTPFLLFGCILLTIVSCQKEKSIDTLNHTPGIPGGGNTGGSEIGTWKFINMNVKTMVLIEMSSMGQAERAITVSDYTTDNNAGTCTFDGSTMTNTGMAYDVDAMSTTYLYLNGTLEDSVDLPFTFTLPPTNSNATYKKIGSDSIFIQSGGLTTPGGGTIQGSSGGYKLNFIGNRMTLTGHHSESKTAIVMGVMQKRIDNATTVITLEKQ